MTEGAIRARGAGRRAPWSRRGLAALLALALLAAPSRAAATPTPAATTPGPEDLLAQARAANLVLVAIAAVAEGRDLPGELSPQIREDIARSIAASNAPLAAPARLTAFAPLVPVHWERAPTPTADTARLSARLLGTVTVAHDAAPGQPARTVRRPLARQGVTVALARRGGRWTVTDIRLNSPSGTLAR